MKNYYQALGIDSRSSMEEIKKAYRQLAQKYHPDAGESEATEAFHKINEAYQCLSSPQKRQEHDLVLEEEAKKNQSSEPFKARTDLYQKRVGLNEKKKSKKFRRKKWIVSLIKVILTTALFFAVGFFLTWLLSGHQWTGATLFALSGLLLGIKGNFDLNVFVSLSKHQIIFRRVSWGCYSMTLFYFFFLLIKWFV